MLLSRISLEICISAAVFYSTFFASKCRADDIPGVVWNSDDGSIQIYRTAVPWTPIQLDREKNNNFAVVAWIAVLSVAVSVAAIVCFCCLCWKLYPKYSRRRQSSNAVLVPPGGPSTVVTFQTNHHDVGVGNSRTRAGNVYSRGVVNFAFTSSLQNPVTPQQDVPPEYSAVISQASPNDRLANTPYYPPVSEAKVVETPPPAYITVAPFQ